MNGIPLTDLKEFSETALHTLGTHWISTAEDLLAASATPEGRTGLCALLSCDAAALERLLAAAAQALPPERAAQLRQPVEPRAMGMLIPEQEEKSNNG